jgi:hypothetical protein
MCVSDTGTELAGMSIPRWTQETKIAWEYIAPGKPQQNAFIESFNGRLRDELLNERDPVQFADSDPGRAGRMEARLQHYPTAQRTRESDTCRICRSQRSPKATGRREQQTAAGARTFATLQPNKTIAAVPACRADSAGAFAKSRGTITISSEPTNSSQLPSRTWSSPSITPPRVFAPSLPAR